jgi:glyoxylase-like metal-dependent hydrolase (beta-lactamase superfamily II)
VLTRYEERLAEATDALSEFLTDAGLEAQHSAAILDMYAVHKSLFASVPVDFVFGSARSSLGPLTVIHTPGHCPGQVVIQVDDILLSGDMVLSDISPHQSPERLTAYTGLGHYLESLTTVERLAPTIRIALGGHQRPIDQLRQRLSAIRDTHQSRLHDVLSAMVRPATMAQVSEMLFPEAVGYNQLLALEEVGAHVEYLHARGYLSLDNADGAGARHSGGHRYRVDPGRPEPRLASADEICPLVNIVASKHRQR